MHDVTNLPGEWGWGTTFESLQGETLSCIYGGQEDEVLIFKTVSGRLCMMRHEQDCCESVTIDDICGDLNNLLDSPLLLAEEQSDTDPPEPVEQEYEPESFTWTFYKLSTIKGSVTIRWYGSSNGYYSESITFSEFIMDKSLVLTDYKELLHFYSEEEVAMMLLKALG